MVLKEALTDPRHQIKRLLTLADNWTARPSRSRDSGPAPLFRPGKQASLEERLGEAEVIRLEQRFCGGTPQQELAQHYGTSVSSVKRLLRKRGVRLYTVELKRTRLRRRPLS